MVDIDICYGSKTLGNEELMIAVYSGFTRQGQQTVTHGTVMWQCSITNDSRRYRRCQTCTLQLITLTDMSWCWHVTRHTATNTTDRSIIYAVVRLTTSYNCTCMALAEQSTWQLTNVAMDVDHTWWAWAGQEVIRLKWWNYYVDMIPDVDRGSLFHVL